MKQLWHEQDLIAFFTLTAGERSLLANKSAPMKIGFAVLLKTLQYEGKFPTSQKEIPKAVVQFIARQIDVTSEALNNYKWRGRTIEYHRSAIRKRLGFQRWRKQYTGNVIDWLQANIVYKQHGHEQIKQALLKRLHRLKIEPPWNIVLDRIIDSAIKHWEETFFKHITERLPASVKSEMDRLLCSNILKIDDPRNDSLDDSIVFRQLKAEPGSVSLRSILNETSKLETIRKISLPADLFDGTLPKILKRYRDRVITEPAREMRRHPPYIRYALFAVFLYLRGREITDALVELLNQVVHRIGARAEKTVTKEIIENVKKISGKDEILYKMASAAVNQPDAPARETIFPAVGEKTLKDIIREHKYSGSWYTFTVNTRMRASYRNHYRRMLPAILKALDIRSNNWKYRPVIEAIAILRKYLDSRIQYYPPNEDLPIGGVVPSAWKTLVCEIDGNGETRINRIAYELCVFGSLREKLRCKEAWVIGANRYRNPDEDLPVDFEQKRGDYYAELGLPIGADETIAKLQADMDKALKALNTNVPANTVRNTMI